MSLPTTTATATPAVLTITVTKSTPTTTTTSSTGSLPVSAPILPFCPKEADFLFFIRQLDNYFIIIGAQDTLKLFLLLNSLGRDGIEIFDGLADPKDTFTEAIQQFKDYFCGKTSVLLRRKEFFQARQA